MQQAGRDARGAPPMTTTDTERGTAATRVAGGGPAPRWSLRRLGHHRYGWWALALVVCLVLAGVALGPEGFAGAAGRSDRALTIMIVALLGAAIALWGFLHSLLTAVLTRARDDVRVYGVGQAVELQRAGLCLDATVDHHPGAGAVRRETDRRGAGRHVLEAGAERWTVRSRARELTARDAAGRVVAGAARRGRTEAGGRWWEIGVEGRRFVLRLDGRRPRSRRTLIDDRDEAWRVTFGRGLDPRRTSARVPEDLSPAAATFVAWAATQIEGVVRAAHDRARTTGGGGDSADSGWTWDSSWAISPGDSGGGGGDSSGAGDSGSGDSGGGSCD
jgi:hypothetical protein